MYKRMPTTRSIIKTSVDLCKREGHDLICDEHLDDQVKRSLDRQKELIEEAKRREIA